MNHISTECRKRQRDIAQGGRPTNPRLWSAQGPRQQWNEGVQALGVRAMAPQKYIQQTPYNFVKACIGNNGIAYRCLIDTGSAVNAMRYATARKLGLNIDTSPNCQHLVSANKTKMAVRGRTSAMVSMGEFLAEIDFVVVDELQHPVLFGITALQKQHACIDFNGAYLIIGPDRSVIPMIQLVPQNQVAGTAENFD